MSGKKVRGLESTFPSVRRDETWPESAHRQGAGSCAEEKRNFFLAFVIVPMVLCVYTSFFDSTMGKETRDVFIGFGNYIELFRDSVFLRALKNTIIIVVVSVPITCIFSLWISSAIYQMPGKLLSFFRIVFYLPVITGSVAVTVVWKWMFNNYYGIFNYLGTQTGPSYDICRTADCTLCLGARKCRLLAD